MPVRDDAFNEHGTSVAESVTTLERDPLLRPQARLGGEHGERPPRAELLGDRVKLGLIRWQRRLPLSDEEEKEVDDLLRCRT